MSIRNSTVMKGMIGMVYGLMENEGGRGPDYVLVQECTGRSCRSFSHSMTH